MLIKYIKIVIFVFVFIIVVLFIILSVYYALHLNEYNYIISEKEYNTRYIHEDFENKKSGNGKIITTNEIFLNSSSVLNIYFEIPQNESFWSVGIYTGTSCVDSVNSGNFQGVEAGDSLHLMISSNSNALFLAEKLHKEIHNSMYPYKKYIPSKINYSGSLYVKIEFYNTKSVQKTNVDIFQLDYINIFYSPFEDSILKQRRSNVSEHKILFDKYISENTKSLKSVKVVQNVTRKNVSKYETLNVSDQISSDSNFTIYAVNHFKSRLAVHSHLIFIDADTDMLFRLEITGVKTDKILSDKQIEIRKISFKLPNEIKNFIVCERIFFDCDGGYVLLPENSIPFSVFIE